MNHVCTRALSLGLLLGALALSAGLAHAEGITWVDGWAAGEAKARETGKLMLVYFGRKSPP